MGNGNSNIHVYNSSDYEIYASCDQSLQKGNLSPGESIMFGIGPDGDKYVRIQVYDNQNREIKNAEFWSWCDHSWIVRNDGVIRQRHGEALHVEDPYGTFHSWLNDNEQYYLEQDQQAEEERQQAVLAYLAQIAEQQRQQQIAAEKARQQQIAAEKARQQQIAAEKARQQQIAAEKARQQQIAAEKARQQQIAAEKARQQQIAAEKARQQQIAAEKARQQQIAAEKARQQQIAAEKARQQQIAAEKARQQQIAAEKARQQQIAAEKARQKNIAEEKERQRIAEEKEQQRVAEEKERQRVAEEKERQRVAEEKERQRIAEEKEQQRIAEEKERQRVAEEKEQQKVAEEKEQQRVAEEKEQQRVAEEKEQQRVAEEKEQQRVAEKKERQRIAEKKERQRIAEEKERQRVAEEKEQQRVAEEKERQRVAEEKEQQRVAEEKERQRIAEEKERQRIAEEKEQQRIAEEKERQKIEEQLKAEQEVKDKEASIERQRRSHVINQQVKKNLCSDRNAAWATHHSLTRDMTDLQESSETTITYFSTKDIEFCRPEFETQTQPENWNALDVVTILKLYFDLKIQNNSTDESLIQARLEILEHLSLGNDPVWGYSSPTVHTHCLSAIQYVALTILGKSDFVTFIQLVNQISTTVRRHHSCNNNNESKAHSFQKQPEVYLKTGQLLDSFNTSFLSKMKEAPTEQCISFIFPHGKSTYYRHFDDCIISPILEHIDFPQNPESWSLVLRLLQENCLGDTHKAHILKELLSLNAKEFQMEKRVVILQLILFALTAETDCTRLLGFVHTISKFEVEDEDVLVIRHWLHKLMNQAASLGILESSNEETTSIIVGMLNHDQGQEGQIDGPILQHLITILEDDTSLGTNKTKISAAIASAIQSNQSSPSSNSKPICLDFVVNVIISPNTELEAKLNMMRLAVHSSKNCKLTEISDPVVKKLLSTFAQTAQANPIPAADFKFQLGLLTLLQHGENLFKSKFRDQVVHSVGSTTEKLLWEVDFGIKLIPIDQSISTLDDSIRQGFQLENKTVEIIFDKIVHSVMSGNGDHPTLCSLLEAIINTNNEKVLSTVTKNCESLVQLILALMPKYEMAWILFQTTFTVLDIPEDLIVHFLSLLTIDPESDGVIVLEDKVRIIETIKVQLSKKDNYEYPKVGSQLLQTFEACWTSSPILEAELLSLINSFLSQIRPKHCYAWAYFFYNLVCDRNYLKVVDIFVQLAAYIFPPIPSDDGMEEEEKLREKSTPIFAKVCEMGLKQKDLDKMLAACGLLKTLLTQRQYQFVSETDVKIYRALWESTEKSDSTKEGRQLLRDLFEISCLSINSDGIATAGDDFLIAMAQFESTHHMQRQRPHSEDAILVTERLMRWFDTHRFKGEPNEEAFGIVLTLIECGGLEVTWDALVTLSSHMRNSSIEETRLATCKLIKNSVGKLDMTNPQDVSETFATMMNNLLHILSQGHLTPALDTLAYVGFICELYCGLQDDTIQELNILLESAKVCNLRKSTMNYLEWMNKCIESRRGFGKKTPVNLRKVPKLELDVSSFWITQWAQHELTEVEHFVSNIECSSSFTPLWKTLAFCSIAEVYWKRGDVGKVQDFHLQGIQALVNLNKLKSEQTTCLNLEELDSLFQHSLLEVPYGVIMCHRAQLLIQKGDLELAQHHLRLSLSSASPELKSYAEAINKNITKLVTLTTLALNEKITAEDVGLPLKLKQLHNMLKPIMDLDMVDKHIHKITSGLGYVLTTPEGEGFLNLCLEIGDRYDLNVVEIHPPNIWATELIRSGILSRFTKASVPFDMTEFDQIWDSLLMYHDSYLDANLSLCTKIQKIFNNVFHANLVVPVVPTRMYLAIVCLHVDLTTIPVDTTTEEQLQMQWLRNRFQSETVDSSINSSFWEAVSRCGLTSDLKSMLTLQRLVDWVVSTSYPLSDLIQFLCLAAELRSPAAFIDFVMMNNNTEDKLGLDIIQTELQNQVIDSLIQDIFKPISTNLFGPSTKFMEENCQLVCKRMYSHLEGDGGNWDFSVVKKLLTVVNSKILSSSEFVGNATDYESEKQLVGSVIQTLNTISSYKYDKELRSQIVDLLSSTDITEWLQSAKELALFPRSEGEETVGKEGKSIEQLFSELEQTNTESNPVFIQELPELHELVKVSISANEGGWTADQIRNWCGGHDPLTTPITEYVFMLKEAVKLHKGFYPRNTQILSFLTLATTTNSEKGRLCNIATGEGKSVIVAMLAAFLALQGKCVDIITSSPILASRDAKEFESFYEILGLSCGDTSELQTDRRRSKLCYELDIVYGDSSTFEADVLRQEFSRLNTRGGRGFDSIIVDEVDSMLIDQGGHSTRLVDKMPGMDHLEPVLMSVWMHLNNFASLLIPIDNQLYFVSQPMSTHDPSDLLDTIAGIIKMKSHPNGNSLRDAITQFSSKALESELKSEEARDAISTLIAAGAIETELEIPDVNDPDAEQPHISEELIDSTIRGRWSLSSDQNILLICQKLLERRITVITIDADGELGLSPRYHNDEETPELDDEEMPRHIVMEEDNSFLELIPVSDEIQFLKEKVDSEVRKMFEMAQDDSVEKELTRFQLPRHLFDLYETKLEKWIASSLVAKYQLKEERDYVLKNNEDLGIVQVVPVDYENTGVLQDGTVWSDGLHQFLQIKHELGISPEHLATNYLSNLAFFRRYTRDIYGLTGTLGSFPERNLLSEVYNVDTVAIPKFNQKRHVHLNDLILPSLSHWLAGIGTSVLSQVALGRAVLIVCKSINDVNVIEDHLRNHMKYLGQIQRDLETYTRSDNEEEALNMEKSLGAGTVIIATNLAGRGTDVKLTPEVISNGGLHVCIAFLPNNLRVEEQAAGRASRQGQPGSSQLILNAEVDCPSSDMGQSYILNPVKVKEARDMEEERRVAIIRSDTIPGLEADERIFYEFCEKRNDTLDHLMSEDDSDDIDNSENKHILASLDERWGIYLDIAKCTLPSTLDQSHFDNMFDYFLSTGGFVNNPYYYILQGNDYNAKRSYEDALHVFDKAADIDKTYSANAYYYGAYSIINQFGDDYKQKAFARLEQAGKLIGNVFIPMLLSLQQMGPRTSPDDSESGDENEKEDTEFTKQVLSKISLLKIQFKSIENAVEMINKYKDVEAEMVGIDNYFEEVGEPVPKMAIDEFRQTGLCGFLKVVKKSSPWWAYLTVIVVGLVQCVVGFAMVAFSGGALASMGVGLIIDGAMDFYHGLNAAVKGDYIDLGEFFKDKGISLLINVAAAGIGGLVSKFGSKIAQWGSKLFAKITSPGARSMLMGAGSMFYKVGSATKGFFKFLGQKAISGLKWLGSKLKVDKAWALLKKGYTVSKNWVKNRLTPIFNKVNPMSTLSESQRLQVKLTAKAVAGGLIKTGLLQGVELIMDATILGPLRDGIKSALYSDINSKNQYQMGLKKNSDPIEKYFSQVKTKEEFDRKWAAFQSTVLTIIHEDFGTRNASEGLAILFKTIETVSAEIERIMCDEKKMGHRNVIGTIVKHTTKVILESTKFGLLVDELANYVPRVFDHLREEIENQNLNANSAKEGEISPYSQSPEWYKEIEFMKNAVGEKMAEAISAYMAQMIENGLIKPKVTDLAVNGFVKRVNPIKENKVISQLEDFERDRGHGERNPSASVWDMLKGPRPLNEGSDSIAIKKPNLTMTELERTDLTIIASELKRPIELYRLNPITGNIDLSATVGYFNRSRSLPVEPIRILGSSGGNIQRSKSDGGVRYDPILRLEGGGLQPVPLEEVHSSFGRMGTTQQLIAVSTIQGDARNGGVDGNDSLANLVYRFKTRNTFPSKRSLSDINILGSSVIRRM